MSELAESPRSSIVPGRRFSTTTSASRARRRKTARPASRLRSRARERPLVTELGGLRGAELLSLLAGTPPIQFVTDPPQHPGVRAIGSDEPDLVPVGEDRAQRAGRAEVDSADGHILDDERDAPIPHYVGQRSRANGRAQGALHAAVEGPPASVEAEQDAP